MPPEPPRSVVVFNGGSWSGDLAEVGFHLGHHSRPDPASAESLSYPNVVDLGRPTSVSVSVHISNYFGTSKRADLVPVCFVIVLKLHDEERAVLILDEFKEMAEFQDDVSYQVYCLTTILVIVRPGVKPPEAGFRAPESIVRYIGYPKPGLTAIGGFLVCQHMFISLDTAGASLRGVPQRWTVLVTGRYY